MKEATKSNEIILTFLKHHSESKEVAKSKLDISI